MEPFKIKPQKWAANLKPLEPDEIEEVLIGEESDAQELDEMVEPLVHSCSYQQDKDITEEIEVMFQVKRARDVSEILILLYLQMASTQSTACDINVEP